jgi:hypothetical protein
MADLTKMISDFTGADPKAQQAKERLELLKNSAQAHLQLAEDKIAEDLAGNSGGIHKLFIVPDTVMDFEQGYTVSSSETIDKGLSSAIDQFFSGETKDGFKTVVKSGLSVLFADTTAGEKSKYYYFVAMEHNAFIRVDVNVWKYYFSQKSLQDDVQQAFCYTFCKSIIDHKKVSADTLIYLVSSFVGDDLTKVQSYIEAIRKLYESLNPKNPADIARHAMAMFKA